MGRAPSVEPQFPLQGIDPELQSIAKRMSAALVEYYRERGVHVGMNDNWTQFFSDADKDGTDRLTLQEFDQAVRKRLRADVSRFEIRALWRRIDTNNSGMATRQEFVQLLYKISLSDWPDLSQQEITRITEVLNSAVNRWHKAGGNWYKVFKHIDAENSGRIGFDEFSKYVRGTLPGLRIPLSVLSDVDLRGYWKAIDDEGSMDVILNKFMVFMRKHGAALSMHKSPRKSTASKTNITQELSSVGKLQNDELTNIANKLGEALHSYLARQGMDGGSSKLGSTSPRVWTELFETIAAKKSTRITFRDFESAVKVRLRAGKVISDTQLRAFWCAVDSDCSGEATRDEFINFVYRLQLKSWPELDSSALERVVKTLNGAADHYYRCSGNWYKVFAKFDEDRSGTMEFDELVAFLRRPLPGLRIPVTLLPDDEVRGLWRALDADRSGSVSTREFTAFMRQHGKMYSMHKQARLKDESQIDADAVDLPPTRTRQELQEIARTLEKALVSYWKSQGIHQRIGVQGGDWAGLFNECRFARKGRFTLAELTKALEKRFQALVANGASFMKRALHDDVRSLWACVKPDAPGYVTEKEWVLTMYRLMVEAWPIIDEAGLIKIVNEMDRAADQWHRAGGNWYKVFRLVDADGSAQLAFDELQKICRAPLPCLAITAEQITNEELKGLWRALDADMSGEVTVQEFMIFMRRHATKQIHQSPKLQNQLKMAQRRAQTQTLVTLTAEQLRAVGRALSGISMDMLASAYDGWGVPWTGVVTEWELLRVVRHVLRLDEKLMDDDAVDALWSSLDRENAGKIQASALLALGSELMQALENAEQ